MEICVTECTYIKDFKPSTADQVNVQGEANDLTLDVILGPLDVRGEMNKLRGWFFSI